MDIEKIIASGKYDCHTIEDVTFPTRGRTDYREVVLTARHNDGLYLKTFAMDLDPSGSLFDQLLDFLAFCSPTEKKPVTEDDIRQSLRGIGYFTLNHDQARFPPVVEGITYDSRTRLFTLSPDFSEEGFYKGDYGFLLGVGDTELIDHLPTEPFTSFAEEKEFRRQHGRNRVWAWGGEDYLHQIESGIREVVAALNRLPFAYASGWSCSGTPNDNDSIVKLKGRCAPRKNYSLDSLAGGDSAFVGGHAGYIIFRADETDVYRRFHADICALPGVEVRPLPDSNKNTVLIVRADPSHVRTNKVRAYQADLEQKWLRVLSVMNRYAQPL